MTGFQLQVKLLSFRRLAVLPIALLTMILTAAFSVLVTVGDTVHNTFISSVREQYADQPYLVQASSAKLNELVSQTRIAMPFRTYLSSVTSDTGATSASVLEYAGTHTLPASILAGRAPKSPTEVAVSRALADRLGLSVGDTVDITDEAEPSAVRAHDTVTAITVSRREADALFVARRTAVEASHATTWLLAGDPTREPSLQSALRDRTILMRTTDILAEDTLAKSPVHSVVQQANKAAQGLLVLAAALIAVLLIATLKGLASTRSAMLAAGFSGESITRILLGSALLVLAGSAAVGASLGVALVRITSRLIDDGFNQYWRGVSTSPVELVIGCVCVVLGSLALVAVTSYPLAESLRRQSHVRTPSEGHSWLAISAFAAGLAAWALTYAYRLNPLLALLGSFGLVVGSIGLMSRASLHGCSRALQKLIAASRRGIVLVVLSATAIAAIASLYSAHQLRQLDIKQATTSDIQPPGSLAVLSISHGQQSDLSSVYKSLGGNSLRVFSLVDERKSQLRATSPKLVDCQQATPNRTLESLLQECGPADTQVPINTVVLSAEPDASEVRADPALISQGRVGLIQYDTLGVSRPKLATTPVGVDPLLGGNLPGAVAGQRSSVAKAYGLVPSGFDFVVYLDFGSLSPSTQAQFRRAVLTAAPAAQIGEPDQLDTASRAGVADLVALSGAGLSFLVLLAGGWAFSEAQTTVRRSIAELGVPVGARRALTARLFLPAGAAVLAAVVGTTVASWFLGGHHLSSQLVWLAPFLALSAAFGLVMFKFAGDPANVAVR